MLRCFDGLSNRNRVKGRQRRRTILRFDRLSDRRVRFGYLMPASTGSAAGSADSGTVRQAQRPEGSVRWARRPGGARLGWLIRDIHVRDIHKRLHPGNVGLGEGVLLAGGEVLQLDGAGLGLVAAVDG